MLSGAKQRYAGDKATMNRDIKRKSGAWGGVCLSFLLFLQLANTYWKVADLAHMPLGIALVTVVSILVVWKKWRRVPINPP
jgi:hypothetical protein